MVRVGSVLLLTVATAIWVGIQYGQVRGQTVNYLTNVICGSLYCLGGVAGLFYSDTRGIGRLKRLTLFFLGSSQLSWGIAALIWSFYTMVMLVEVPFPSVADIFYVGFTVLMVAACLCLLLYLKAPLEQSNVVEFFGVIVVVYLAIFVLMLQPNLDFEAPILSNLLNYFYPLGDAFVFSFLLLIYRLASPRAKRLAGWLMAGLLFQVIADLMFTYRQSHALYWNGDISDYLYAVSGFLMTWGTVRLIGEPEV